jgi:hypothetical protein
MHHGMLEPEAVTTTAVITDEVTNWGGGGMAETPSREQRGHSLKLNPGTGTSTGTWRLAVGLYRAVSETNGVFACGDLRRTIPHEVQSVVAYLNP